MGKNEEEERYYYLPYIHSAYDYDIVYICISYSVLILIPFDSTLLFGPNNYYIT